MFLEDCGERIPPELYIREPDTADTIVSHCRRIHEAGLATPRLWFDTDLVRNEVGDIRIVGFSGMAQEGHKCELNARFERHSLDRNGEWKDFGCEDMYEIAYTLDWLTPGCITIGSLTLNLVIYNTTKEMAKTFEPLWKDISELSSEEREYRETRLALLEDEVEKYNATFGKRDRNVVLRHYPDLKAKGIWPPVTSKEKTASES
ncbi:hypothetical protein BDY19DRAFT_520839 [Irpex rosettiformis]|uniref:Uncharacterized protein n=1 Tax=Irpex rosettiformis TaxID=378272 RepID=A0ACB8TRE2_9APHY|nr:hypothetical protein BDY19DRAFT_520839 [Irpex rosettiformis]